MLGLAQTTVLLISLFMNAWNDWKKQQIYMLPLIITAISGILFHIFLQRMSIWDVFFGALVGFLLIIYSYFTKESVGYGDGGLFMVTGVFLGFWVNLELLTISFLLAAIAGIILMLCKRKKKEDRIPLVPFVLIAYLLTLI